MPPTNILNIFSRSPVAPLQKHMHKAHDCAHLLAPFFDAINEQDWPLVVKIRDKIAHKEREADELKMDFRLHVPKNIFLPVPRVDLLEMLSKQDKIANIAKDISGIMLGRKMQIPAALRDDMHTYLQRSLETVTQALDAVNELDEILESGFSNKEIQHVEQKIKLLNQSESETDRLQIAIRQLLFDIEQELQPVDVMFLYQIIEWIGLLADLAQKTGARLRMLASN